MANIGGHMRQDIVNLIHQCVDKQAKVSAEYGVTYNQADRTRKFNELKNQFIAGEITRETLVEYLNEE
jgi:GTPase Era involved in 16S rRNA processing